MKRAFENRDYAYSQKMYAVEDMSSVNRGGQINLTERMRCEFTTLDV